MEFVMFSSPMRTRTKGWWTLKLKVSETSYNIAESNSTSGHQESWATGIHKSVLMDDKNHIPSCIECNWKAHLILNEKQIKKTFFCQKKKHHTRVFLHNKICLNLRTFVTVLLQKFGFNEFAVWNHSFSIRRRKVCLNCKADEIRRKLGNTFLSP